MALSADDRNVTWSSEAGRLEQHLALLRQEHVSLQQRFFELQRRYDILEASCAQGGAAADSDAAAPSFVQHLVQSVGALFENDQFSDLTILLDGHHLRAHRFVLATRSAHWGVADLSLVEKLVFEELDYSVGYTLLRWVYTDQLDSKLGDAFLMDLMKAGKRFRLLGLLSTCEQMLVSRMDMSNCVRIYQVADELSLSNLREKCAHLIAARWDDFSAADFETMAAPLLFKMLRSKTDCSLHGAIRLRREDVVFLYLIEFDAELATRLNCVDADGALPLGLALSTGQHAVARTLVSHGADVNAVDGRQRPLLACAVAQRDVAACTFLLSNSADRSAVHAVSGRSVLHELSDFKSAELSEEFASVLDTVMDCVELDVNRKDSDGRTALHYAVCYENTRVVERLLKSPLVNVNVQDNFFHTALMIALTGDAFHLADTLISRGADVNCPADSDGNCILSRHILDDRLESVAFLLKRGADANLCNSNGEAPLHHAATAGLADVVAALLGAGADANRQCSCCQQTPLHRAIANSRFDVAERLLVSGGHNEKIDLTLTDATGRTAFEMTLLNEAFACAEKLAKAGADLNAMGGDGRPLLLGAIARGHEDVALFLIREGAALGARGAAGETALQVAVGAHSERVVRALCAGGVDTNARGSGSTPPLWVALTDQHEAVASVLVQNGCDVDCWAPVDGGGGCLQTLLHRAIDENNHAMAVFLIRSGCAVNACRRAGANGEGAEEVAERQTPLHLAASWSQEEVAQALIEHGAAVNAQDADGQTPLHVAVVNGQDAILQMLLRSPDVSLKIRDKRGRSAFAVAMKCRNTSAAKLILRREPRSATEVDNKGCNLLHTAIKEGSFESVLFLLSVNLPINLPMEDSSKYTPLHLAADGDNEMILRNLLLAGADPNAPNARRQTALHLAAAGDKASFCTILIENECAADARDSDGNNALHCAVYRGSIGCVRALLTESRIDAEAVNNKGQNPLHVLGQYGKDNASAIFELFVETMPSYPVDARDAGGNSVLLLAYMNGNAQLCKAAIQAGARVGARNDDGVTLFNFQTPTKQLLVRLLDQLAHEPKWATEGDVCSECSAKFSITVRKHHCRHCGRMLCAKCSERTIPIIKYSIQKPVRVCDVCYDVLTLGAQ